MAVKLNTVVTDSITGFKGTAVSRTEFLHACVRYGVKPLELKDGLPQDTHFFDELQLKENDPSTTPARNKWLGKKGTDSITGVTGTITSATDYIFQATRLSITPKGTFEGKPAEVVDVDEAQLQEYKAPAVVKKTGGPGDKAPMHRAAPRF